MFTPLSINPNSIVISSRDELEREFGPFEKISKTLFRANEYAIKILPLGRAETENEIEISNLLNLLQGVTQIFSFTHGYVLNRDELYLFSNLIDAPFSALPDEPQINQDFYFEVLSGIYFARKQFQFTHWDIHEGNLMFNRLPEPTDRSYPVGATYVTIQNSRIQPKLIDYGKSAVGMGEYSDAQWRDTKFKKLWNKPDIYHLSWIFAGRKELSETFRDFLQSEIIEGMFQNDGYPRELRRDSADNTGNIERLVQVFFPVNCASCANPNPSFRCSDCLGVAYCSSKCQEVHWVAGHAMECIGGGGIKRERVEEELNAEMSPALEASLNNPARLRDLAYFYPMDQIVKISENFDTDTFGGRLNEVNVFWYWVVVRLAQEEFVQNRNYKTAARALLLQWKEDFGESYKQITDETEDMVEKATLEQLKTTPKMDQFVYFYILRRFSRDYNRPINYRWVFMSFK